MPLVSVSPAASITGEIASSRDLLELLRASADLHRACAAAAPTGGLVDEALELAAVDSFATLAAIEALAAIRHPAAADALVSFLHHDAPIVARHASWRLAATEPIDAAMVTLVHRLSLGGIDTMHAHRTLRRWAVDEPGLVLASIHDLLPTVDRAGGRARLVDLMGAIDHPTAEAGLLLVAQDGAEAPTVRAAAVGALGHRAVAGAEPILRTLAMVDDELGLNAALALDELDSQRCSRPLRRSSHGLHIAQLTMTGELDRGLSSGGKGDTGGVASLIVSLGEALARRPEVDRVLTIGRSSLVESIAAHREPDRGPAAYASLAIGDADRPVHTPGDAWEHLPAVERALVRVLRNHEPVDLVHLRMADVGTLAAVDVAASMGIEVCFSLAPDPHGLIQSMQEAGELDRSSFVDLAERENVWFRARFVERLAADIPRLALFPRREAETLVEPSARTTDRRRAVVVPEGVDVSTIRTVEADFGRSQTAGTDAGVLDDLATMIPESRRHLPLALSVGRLTPVKGMERLVRSWANGSWARRSGARWSSSAARSTTRHRPSDRSSPTSRAAVPDDHHGPVGPRSCSAVDRDARSPELLVATAAGWDGAWADGGIYVNGAYKEEFGLALVEAMAAGLVVVAPSTGGPATYVDHGETGVLVGPQDDLATAMDRAFELVDRPGRAERSRRLVDERYSIETMADRLLDLYLPTRALPEVA